MKQLGLTVLAIDGPVARAYLWALRESGYRVAKVIELKLDAVLTAKEKKLSGIVGKPAARMASRLIRKVSGADGGVNRELEALLKRDAGLEFPDACDYREFGESYERVKAPELNSDEVRRCVGRQACQTFLFTGGGILRGGILGVPGVRFLHFHPGIVPEVKGSDGFFWSVLERGKPGVSCFYMNEGIDTGEIVLKREFERPVFGEAVFRHPEAEIYRSILKTTDPVLRARTLVSVVEKTEELGCGFGELPVERQDPAAGRTFFFMHPEIRKRVVRGLGGREGGGS